MPTVVLFMLCSFAWGSTWYAITWQLSSVDPLWSICYRFLLAAFFSGLLSLIRKNFEKYSFHQHCWLMLQGSCLCGLSYWLIYLSEMHITSALSAVISSTILYMNVVFGRILFGNIIRIQVVIGGLIGSGGIAAIFLPQIEWTMGAPVWKGIALAFSGCIFFSLGSLASQRNERYGMGLLPAATYAMFYGGLVVAVIALIMGIKPSFSWSVGYISSLLYLAIVGSVIAMVTYMSLIRTIGADRSGYVDIVLPVIALLISTLFEGYVWTPGAMAGVLMIMLGNYVAMRH